MHSNATFDAGRPSKRLLVLIVTLLLSAILFAASASSASALPPNFFGLMPDNDQAHAEADLEAAARSGAKYWRIGFNCFEWYGNKENVWKENWDEQVELAWKHGLQPLATVESRCKQVSGEIPHEDEWGLWEELAKALVSHYGYLGSFWRGKENKKEIEVWEIQNEPNLAEHGWEGNASGSAYAKVFKRTSESIHSAQGSFFPSRVIVGGLYYVHNDAASKTPHTFMQEMAVNYPAVVPWIDGVAIHPYEWGSGAVSATEADINGARSDINAFFGSSKSLWITEIGWNVENGAAGFNEGHSYPEVNETEQSNRLTELFNWVRGVQEGRISKRSSITATGISNTGRTHGGHVLDCGQAYPSNDIRGARFDQCGMRSNPRPVPQNGQSSQAAKRKPQPTSPLHQRVSTERSTLMACQLGTTLIGLKVAKDSLTRFPLALRKWVGGKVVCR